MASWWTGVWRWPSLIAAVEPQLIPSRRVYAGQGHCFALSRVADHASQDVLLRYLQLYLNQPESDYDQSWAMAALRHVSSVLGTNLPNQVRADWRNWSRGKQVDLDRPSDVLTRLHEIADQVAATEHSD